MQEAEISLTKQDYESLAAFRAAIRRFTRFSEEGARALGITPQQHQAMLAIMGQPGRQWASIAEIADFLQLKHHTAVGLIDRCAAAGLAERSPDPDDRRQVRVTLTAKGEGLLRTLSTRNLRELKSLRKLMKLSVIDRRAEL
ncbi:MAG TPA: MarR family transcriptional regulator [Fimbriimonadaceae bacterium]|nr:MarR family transcriptional regulator [Fimbriimonadaceae bacterium]